MGAARGATGRSGSRCPHGGRAPAPDVDGATAGADWFKANAASCATGGSRRSPSRPATSGRSCGRRATSTSGDHAGGHATPAPRGADGGGRRRDGRRAGGDEPGRAARVGAGVVHPAGDRAESPFRFLVLDDPIQAMDPAKVEGFVRVLRTSPRPAGHRVLPRRPARRCGAPLVARRRPCTRSPAGRGPWSPCGRPCTRRLRYLADADALSQRSQCARGDEAAGAARGSCGWR